MSRFAVLLVVYFATLLPGCASLTSTRDQANPPNDAGLVYRLPLRNLTVTLSNNDQGSAPEVSVAASPAYPDMNHRFVLKFATNLIGSNELDVAIDERGLLTSASSKTTAQIGDVLANVAGGVGAAAGPLALQADAHMCTRKGNLDREVIIPPPFGVHTTATQGEIAPTIVDGWYELPTIEIYDKCLVTLAMKPLGGFAEGGGKAQVDHLVEGRDTSRSGVFHRNNRTFLVRAGLTGSTITPESNDANTANTVGTANTTNTTTKTTFVVMLPDLRSIEYLPIKRTLFADNEAKITFVDGSPRTYKQTAGSELVGLTALPARVIKAYVSAVTDSFKTKSASMKEEAAYLAQINALLLQQQATERCLAAEQSDDTAAIAEACE